MEMLFTNIGLLATPVGDTARRGRAQGEIRLVENAAVRVRNGKIAWAGPAAHAPFTAGETIDCGGALVTPGLVDAHTHLVFGGWRQKEFGLKLAGISYLDILRRGGGILSTVDSTRAASADSLVEKGRLLLDGMLAHGTTTVECKSGYGLDLATERKQLQVIGALNESHPIDLVATFMGAHAVPREYTDDREGYIRLLCDEMLPAIAADGAAEFCDAFCETAAFSPDESRLILRRASELGLRLKVHADEIDPIGGSELAAGLGCISAEHLICTSDSGIRALADRGVIAVLLPATSFYLGEPYARAREMIDGGVAVAVATDFNPGSSPNWNLQFPMNLACIRYRLTPAEALTAVTLNAAAAIRRADSTGSVEPGKKADLVVWDAPDLEMIFYRYGSNQVKTVVKDGTLHVIR